MQPRIKINAEKECHTCKTKFDYISKGFADEGNFFCGTLCHQIFVHWNKRTGDKPALITLYRRFTGQEEED